MTTILFSGIDHGDENDYEAGVSDSSSFSAHGGMKIGKRHQIQSEEG